MKFLVTCTAVLALTTMLSAQSDPSGAMPLEETGAQISADTSAQSQIQAFLDSKGWTEGENSGKNGPFIVTTGVGTIAAPPNHPSYAASRPRAFAKAMLAAKSNMSRYLSVSISTAVMSKYQEANNNTTPTPQEEMAAALAAMPPDSLIGKARAYTGAKLDNLLRKEGVSVDVQREAAQAAYAAAAEKAKQLAATEEFQRSVNSTSTALISGLQAFFTVEGFDPETKRWTAPRYTKREFAADGSETFEQFRNLDTLINLEVAELGAINDLIQTMNITELNQFLEQQRAKGSDSINIIEVEKHARYAYPLSTFILTLIGVSLSSRKVRGGTGLHIGIGTGLCFSYILFNRFFEEFAKSGTLPTGIAVWLPNIIYLGIAVYLYQKAPK